MRVFYPVSARLSDLLNDETSSPSGWMVLWSASSIVLLLLVVSALPDLGGAAPDQQHESASKPRVNHASHVRYDTRSGQHIITAAVSTNTSTQSYIDAHRCALSYSCVLPAKLPQAEPTRPQAGVGLYL